MVDPISINTDRKGFYQLKEREMLKAREGAFQKKGN